jgi:hypothetical protein
VHTDPCDDMPTDLDLLAAAWEAGYRSAEDDGPHIWCKTANPYVFTTDRDRP